MRKLCRKTSVKHTAVVSVLLVVVFICAIFSSGFKTIEKPLFPVHITYHNMEHVRFVSSGTVNDALKLADIKLNTYDVINVRKDAVLYDGMDIVINEVKYIRDTDIKKTDFDTKYKESDEYPQGYEEVVEKGKKGITQTETIYKYVNGKRVMEGSKKETEISAPKAEVVLRGTAPIARASNIGVTQSASGTINGLSYSKVLTGSATAYTASEGALTATGVAAYVGGVAVNPNIIPYGTKLYIVADGYTYGYATAVDTGGALMDGSALVDLYMSTYEQCINFGRRNVKVYVLN